MPWKVSDAVKERTRFAERYEASTDGRVNISELCRMFRVSRQTGYEWSLP